MTQFFRPSDRPSELDHTQKMIILKIRARIIHARIIHARVIRAPIIRAHIQFDFLHFSHMGGIKNIGIVLILNFPI